MTTGALTAFFVGLTFKQPRRSRGLRRGRASTRRGAGAGACWSPARGDSGARSASAQGAAGGHAGDHRRGVDPGGLARCVMVEVRDDVAHVAACRGGRRPMSEIELTHRRRAHLHRRWRTVVAITIFIAIVRGFLYICRPERDPDLRGPQAHACPTAARGRLQGGAAAAGRCASRCWRRSRAWTCGCSWSRSRSPTPTRRAASRSTCTPSPTSRSPATPRHVRNAVERFLGMAPQQIARGRAADAGGRAARGAGPAHARGGQRGPAQVRRDA